MRSRRGRHSSFAPGVSQHGAAAHGPTARARAVTLAGFLALVVATLAVLHSSPASGSSFTDEIITNPAFTGQPSLIGKRHFAASGSISAILYLDPSGRPWTYVRDSSTGGSTHVLLPQVAGTTWSAVSYVLRSPTDLWVLAGTGPIQLRRYRLDGAGLPTGATLLSTTTLGDGDSRPDDLTALSSGALVAVWHQQGSSGPQGLRITYWNPSTAAWSTLDPLTFMPTFASKFVAVQHPADGSVWIFGNPDSWSAIGAGHLSEIAGALRVDWTNGSFISSSDGAFNADPENPDLEVAADAASGTVRLAYQRAYRRMFSTSPIVTGSYLGIASIAADGSKSFGSMDEYVERVSSLGLIVRSSERWTAYRPIQPDLSFSDLYVRRESGGSWDAPVLLGRLYSPYQQVLAGPASTEILARMADGKVHLFHIGSSGEPAPSPSPTETVSSSPTPSPTPTATATPTAKCKPSKTQKCR
jgi:hypothetical protein